MEEDIYQLLIHDNTYNTNRFKLPAGLFSGVNIHGQTILLVVALSAKEGTADYEWQYQTYLKAVGIPPSPVFTNADPGATATVAEIFLDALHL